MRKGGDCSAKTTSTAHGEHFIADDPAEFGGLRLVVAQFLVDALVGRMQR